MASVAPPETHSQGVLRPGRDPWLCPKPLTEWPRASILRCCIVLPTQRPGLVRPSGGGRLACWPVPVGSTAVWALTFLSRWGAGPQRPWGFRRRARGRGQVPLHSLTRASELLSEACYPTCLQEPRASLSISPRPRHPLACPLSLRGAAWPLPWLHAAQLGGSPSLRRCGLGPPGAAVLVPGTQPLPAPCPGEGPPWPCRGVTVPQLCPEGDSLFPAGAVGWVPVFRSTRGRAAPKCLGLGHGGCWVCGGAVAGPACHSQAPSLPPCSRCTTSPPTPGSTMRTSKCEYVRPRADARGRGRALGSRSLGAGGRPGGSVDQSSGQAEPSWGQSGLGWEGWGGGPVTLRETGLRWGGRARTPHTRGPRDEEGGQESSLCVRGSPWAQGGGVAPGRAGGPVVWALASACLGASCGLQHSRPVQSSREHSPGPEALEAAEAPVLGPPPDGHCGWANTSRGPRALGGPGWRGGAAGTGRGWWPRVFQLGTRRGGCSGCAGLGGVCAYPFGGAQGGAQHHRLREGFSFVLLPWNPEGTREQLLPLGDAWPGTLWGLGWRHT